MLTIAEKLKKIKAALVSVSGKVYHYTKPDNVKAGYIVWAESSENQSFSADNRKQEQKIVGYIDLYTQIEFDPLADAVQNALLNVDGCGFDLITVQYEDETKLIHYTWEFWVI